MTERNFMKFQVGDVVVCTLSGGIAEIIEAECGSYLVKVVKSKYQDRVGRYLPINSADKFDRISRKETKLDRILR